MAINGEDTLKRKADSAPGRGAGRRGAGMIGAPGFAAAAFARPVAFVLGLIIGAGALGFVAGASLVWWVFL
ncbi:hypothetical protein [Mesorhizobium sp. ES1-1]|uniref:hypothetical protein n=1 Tax=Mesorhizobium sp. ES1-1 TaxID=2876629 RepID=UPI001CCE8B4C|nr:hypothetical protein [Mesorhizobium sp. ES1-1]MBZ9678265.1 hypothetical protein [Mesorhizobium sp. ES1-1]